MARPCLRCGKGKDENPWVRRSEPGVAGEWRWGGGNADPAQQDFAVAKPILSRAPCYARGASFAWHGHVWDAEPNSWDYGDSEVIRLAAGQREKAWMENA